MRRKAVLTVLLSVGMALCQNDRRQAANSRPRLETPLRELTTINDAAMIYYSWLKRVPTSLKQLGPGDRKIADQNAADLISSDLASGVHDGYRFTLTGTKAGWTARAVPLTEAPGVQTTYMIDSRIPQVKPKYYSWTPKK